MTISPRHILPVCYHDIQHPPEFWPFGRTDSEPSTCLSPCSAPSTPQRTGNEVTQEAWPIARWDVGRALREDEAWGSEGVWGPWGGDCRKESGPRGLGGLGPEEAWAGRRPRQVKPVCRGQKDAAAEGSAGQACARRG